MLPTARSSAATSACSGESLTVAGQPRGPILPSARRPLRNLADATELLGAAVKLSERDVDVRSSYFEVRGRLRLGPRVVEVHSLVQRRQGLQVVAIQRQVQASLMAGAR